MRPPWEQRDPVNRPSSMSERSIRSLEMRELLKVREARQWRRSAVRGTLFVLACLGVAFWTFIGLMLAMKP